MTLALAVQWTRIYRTKQQHLDLIALGELVALELIFDLFMTLLSLLLLCAHTTTHCVFWRNFSGASDCRLDSAPAEMFVFVSGMIHKDRGMDMEVEISEVATSLELDWINWFAACKAWSAAGSIKHCGLIMKIKKTRKQCQRSHKTVLCTFCNTMRTVLSC